MCSRYLSSFNSAAAGFFHQLQAILNLELSPDVAFHDTNIIVSLKSFGRATLSLLCPVSYVCGVALSQVEVLVVKRIMFCMRKYSFITWLYLEQQEHTHTS